VGDEHGERPEQPADDDDAGCGEQETEDEGISLSDMVCASRRT
jgi:hypothetical protein